MLKALVEIEWVDAVFYGTLDEIEERELTAGGSLLKNVGYVVKLTKRGLLLCAELDKGNRPHRDFNLIPRSLIRKIRIIKRKQVNL